MILTDSLAASLAEKEAITVAIWVTGFAVVACVLSLTWSAVNKWASDQCDEPEPIRPEPIEDHPDVVGDVTQARYPISCANRFKREPEPRGL